MIASNKDLQTEGCREAPISNPCLSFWQRNTRAFPLLDANRDAAVPSKSKYVIIGSGLSGGLTAFKLVEAGVKGSDIVILEAREAASGASSRNAGHVRPGIYSSDQVDRNDLMTMVLIFSKRCISWFLEVPGDSWDRTSFKGNRQ
jgi:FAD dependent oxidoreductase